MIDRPVNSIDCASVREWFDKQSGKARVPLLRLFDECVPVRHRNVRLDLIDDEYRCIVVEVIESLFTRQPKGIFLAGEIGVGKTSTLHVILKSVLTGRYQLELQAKDGDVESLDGYEIENVVNGLRHLFVSVTHFELVRQLREYYGAFNRSDGGLDVVTRPLVFIDDLGRGYDDQSGWNLALLDEYFDRRWQNHRPVFVTTNKKPEELRTWPTWGRIIDRLCDPIWMRRVWISGKSKRTKEFIEQRESRMQGDGG